MRIVLHLSAAVLVVVSATWAYRVNYATQEAMGRLDDLRQEIADEREAIAVLNAEWAYLNRPDRLKALVAANAAALGLEELTPDAVRRGVHGRLPARARRPRRRRRARATTHPDRSPPVIRRPLRPLARILRARAEGRTRTSSRPRSAPPGSRRATAPSGPRPRRGSSCSASSSSSASPPSPAAWRCSRPPFRSSRAAASPPTRSTPSAPTSSTATATVLATNIVTASLYAQPEQMIDPRGGRRRAGRDLPRPRRRTSSLARLTDGRKFIWIEKIDLARAAPAGARPRRARPALRPARDAPLPERHGRRPRPRRRELRPRGRARGRGRSAPPASSASSTSACATRRASTSPLRLSIDLKAQTALEDVLAQGMQEMRAKGAVGILMEADTGQIRALASLPDFDPNVRPPLPT